MQEFVLGPIRTIFQWSAAVLAAALVEARFPTGEGQLSALALLAVLIGILWLVQRKWEANGTAVVIQARTSGYDDRLFSDMKDFATRKFRFVHPLQLSFDSDVTQWNRPMDVLAGVVNVLLDDRQAGEVDKSRVALFLNGPQMVCWWLGTVLGNRNQTQVWGQMRATSKFDVKVTGLGTHPSRVLNEHRRNFDGSEYRCVLILAEGRENDLSSGHLPWGTGETLVIVRPNVIPESEFGSVAQESYEVIRAFLREGESTVLLGTDGPVEIAFRLGQLCSGDASRMAPLHFDKNTNKYLMVGTPSQEQRS
jgi:hypothetical protein